MTPWCSPTWSKTEKGIFVRGDVLEDLLDEWEDIFIPESQIDEDSDLHLGSSVGDEGKLIITKWLADKRGWLDVLE